MAESTIEETAARNCVHKRFSKERIMGSHTGDYECDHCDKTFSLAEKTRIEEAHKQNQK
ncbi:hypothetical protein OV208_40070 [Corallococcus sp. bb12-1]|uniref:hypothetical protein n=1 Tax=Corallococcus sp. bb12-1 TaxID=2996784 RepID=UPI00226F42D1|nr:hypothetical protein [Corallococcus sp. bb12-1]MCY1047565.1 hypothetical protein [Corallococcus sp. bb12-1]